MKKDLKAMTRGELEKLKANVEKALEKLAEKDKQAALIAAEKAAAAHGFSLAQLTGGTAARGKAASTRKTGPKTVSAPKYKNPADPSQTWTGKGRQPEWFKSALAGGKSPDELEV